MELTGIHERSEWESWLEYFFNGVARQSEDALSRAERINKKLLEWRKLIADTSTKTPSLVIDMIAANPFITVKDTAEKLKIAFTTAQRAIDRLEKLNILKKENDAKRDRIYCAKDIFDILEEPAKLMP